MDKFIKKDIEDFVATFSIKEKIEGTKFLITGITGLIGSELVHCLLALDSSYRIIAPVRNVAKAKAIFEDAELLKITLIECDLMSFDYSRIENVDYVIHCAAPTASRYFVEHPVETFNFIYQSTFRLLEFAKKAKPRSLVYLSSLEVYGIISDDSYEVTEEIQGNLDCLSVRSSYPMAKRAAECLCHLYAKEYGVNVKIARLTQTTGAGIAKDDNRIIAQFARLTALGQDIVLHSKGDSARPYCYITDSISAILYALLRGEIGEAYNICNAQTYISAYNMAKFLQKNFNSSIRIKIELNDNMGYAPTTKLRLSSQKLEQLGWKPTYGLREIFNNLIFYIQKNENIIRTNS